MNFSFTYNENNKEEVRARAQLKRDEIILLERGQKGLVNLKNSTNQRKKPHQQNKRNLSGKPGVGIALGGRRPCGKKKKMGFIAQWYEGRTFTKAFSFDNIEQAEACFIQACRWRDSRTNVPLKTDDEYREMMNRNIKWNNEF